MSQFKDYASFTEEQKKAIIARYHQARKFPTCAVDQAVTIAACEGLELTKRQWSGKTGSNAFAAALAVLVIARVIELKER